MARFKTARRQPNELAEAKQELDNLFIEAVRKGGVNSSSKEFNPRGIQKIREHEFELAELMVQVIQDIAVTTDPANFLVDDMDAALGDQHIWQQMDASLRAFRRSPGSKPLSQRLTWKEWSMTTSQKEIAVEVPLEEVAVGRTTPSQVAEAIAFAYNRHRISALLDAIDAGVPSATNDRTGVAGYTLRYSGITTANLNKAIDGIMDEGGTPAIMARHIALQPVLRTAVQADTNTYSGNMKQVFEQRGVTGQYNGAAIVTLQDSFSKYTGSHAIRSDRIYIASGVKGAIRKNVDLAFLNWAMTDSRTATFGTGIRWEDGILVWDPYRYRVVEA